MGVRLSLSGGDGRGLKLGAAAKSQHRGNLRSADFIIEGTNCNRNYFSVSAQVHTRCGLASTSE
jgi:hypothetical protein